jgi:hypothetical protein
VIPFQRGCNGEVDQGIRRNALPRSVGDLERLEVDPGAAKRVSFTAGLELLLGC